MEKQNSIKHEIKSKVSLLVFLFFHNNSLIPSLYPPGIYPFYVNFFTVPNTHTKMLYPGSDLPRDSSNIVSGRRFNGRAELGALVGDGHESRVQLPDDVGDVAAERRDGSIVL